MPNTYFDEAMLKSNTENGRDYLRKYLHPPGDKGTSYNGYPDKSTTPVIHAEYRQNNEGFKPLTTAGEFPANTMLMLTAPGLLHNSFYATSAGPNDDPHWTQLYTNRELSADSIISNFGRYRMAYHSITCQLDATAFSNAGMIYHSQFSPATYTIDFSVVAAKIASGLVKSRTILPDSSEGFTILGKKPRAITYDNMKFQIVKLGQPVLNPTDITMLSPKSYTSRATEGCFSVFQCNEDVNQFKAIELGTFDNGQAGNNLLICGYEYTIAGITYIETFTDGSAIGSPYTRDASWSDWTWSITAFVGLSPSNATTNGGLINIKDVAGYEVAPTPRSILNSQISAPALYDPTALQSAAVITQSRADGMPASYNSAGLMASVASSILPSAAKALASAVTGADAKSGEKQAVENVLERSDANHETPEQSAVEVPNNGELKPTHLRNRTNRSSKNAQKRQSKDVQILIKEMRKMFNGKRVKSKFGPRNVVMRGRSNSRARTPTRNRSRTRSQSRNRNTVTFVRSTNRK